MFFDTHVHFHETDGERGIDDLVSRAAAAGVDRLVAVGGDCPMNRLAVEAARRYPESVWPAIGFDRDQPAALAMESGGVTTGMERLSDNVGALRKQGMTVAALGEMGLDYHYSADTADAQKALFEAQLRLAEDFELPVVVHSREADEDTLRLLEPFAERCREANRSPGVLHCFTGSGDFARELLALGLYISFSGIVTFRNADPLREVASGVPADRILIETDTPFLAPVPHRGKRNEPAFVADVAVCLSEIRETTVEEIARITTDNARALFGV
jgi:TatD DNase family protein